MPLFEFRTESIFENVYLIEADSHEEAVARTMANDFPPNFYQKHLGEVVVCGHELIEGDPSPDDIAIAENSLKERGYL